MIAGGWTFIWAAYGVALSALVVLTLVAVLRLAHWSKCARDLERRS
jgi:heme exporter protein D